MGRALPRLLLIGLLVPSLIGLAGLLRARMDVTRVGEHVERVRAAVSTQERQASHVALVLALIHAESRGIADAVSSVEARGLMQLRAPAAGDMARRLGRPAPAPDDLFDPDLNVALGVAYLAWCMERFDGDVDLGLLGWRTGCARVARWLVAAGGRDALDTHPDAEGPWRFVRRVRALEAAWTNRLTTGKS